MKAIMKLDDLTTADQLAGFLSKVRMSKLPEQIARLIADTHTSGRNPTRGREVFL